MLFSWASSESSFNETTHTWESGTIQWRDKDPPRMSRLPKLLRTASPSWESTSDSRSLLCSVCAGKGAGQGSIKLESLTAVPVPTKRQSKDHIDSSYYVILFKMTDGSPWQLGVWKNEGLGPLLGSQHVAPLLPRHHPQTWQPIPCCPVISDIAAQLAANTLLPSHQPYCSTAW